MRLVYGMPLGLPMVPEVSLKCTISSVVTTPRVPCSMTS